MSAAPPVAPGAEETALRSTRRRGDALLDAIVAAVVDELATHGYRGLTIERVAERAGTGKASIYRRWHNRLELVLEALDRSMPRVGEVPDTGNVRDDLIGVLSLIAATMNSRVGDATRACMVDIGVDDELATAVRERLLPPRKQVIVEILRRGAERGEVRPEAVTERMAEAGPMLLHGEVVQRGTPIPPEAVRAIVDEVLLPALRPAPA
jgi:AcrR family transcriptional regulator